jgi:hypothetical protein
MYEKEADRQNVAVERSRYNGLSCYGLLVVGSGDMRDSSGWR